MLASTEKLQEAGFGERVFTDRDLARFCGTPALWTKRDWSPNLQVWTKRGFRPNL